MPRLIDADKLAKDINSLSTHLLNEWDTMGVLMQIDKQATVDAVEVVRCKDCRNWVNEKCNHIGLKGTNIGVTAEMWFCGDGERKENGIRQE